VIAQVVAPGAVGGLETVVGALLVAAARHQKPMCCVALLPRHEPVPHALADAAASAGTSVFRVDAPHRKYIAQYRALRAALQSAGVAMVHSHGYHADVMTAIVKRPLGLAQISTLHGFVGGTRRSRVYEGLQLRALRHASAVVGVSQPIVDRAVASGIDISRVQLIANAAPETALLPCTEARAVLGLSASARAVAWIGRFSQEKHPVGFVEMLAALPVEQGIVGVMIGEGPCLAEVRSVGASLIDSGRLVIAGTRPAAGRLLSAFDALVITSSTEGTPMVALEAMRAGVPVLSTAVGGVPALLADGDAGLLVPFGAPSVMASALTALLSDQRTSRRLTQVAHDRLVAHYGLDAWWARYAAVYASAVNGFPGSWSARRHDQSRM
jgi:glycosyltransferase involved in cell wall biosynthesis